MLGEREILFIFHYNAFGVPLILCLQVVASIISHALLKGVKTRWLISQVL